jgi:hypothetical protein
MKLMFSKLISDLGSGEFKRQNVAARFLYGTEAAHGSAEFTVQEDIQLGAALVDAAPETYPAHGAREALELNRLLAWPPSRLAGALWASLTTHDRTRLRSILSVRAANLIAAMAATDVLSPTLDMTRTLLCEHLSEADWKESIVEALVRELDELTEGLEVADKAAAKEFTASLQSPAIARGVRVTSGSCPADEAG